MFIWIVLIVLKEQGRLDPQRVPAGPRHGDSHTHHPPQPQPGARSQPRCRFQPPPRPRSRPRPRPRPRWPSWDPGPR